MLCDYESMGIGNSRHTDRDVSQRRSGRPGRPGRPGRSVEVVMMGSCKPRMAVTLAKRF